MSIDVTTLDVFPFAGVWSGPIKLTRQFVSDIDVAATADETTDALVDTSRIGIAFSLENINEHTEVRTIERFLRSRIGERIVVPIWSEAVVLKESPIGNIINLASTAGRLFSTRRHAILLNCINGYSIFDIQTVADCQLIATAAIPNADFFDAGEFVVPVMITEPITAQAALSFETSYFATGSIEFWEDVTEASALPFNYNTPVYAGLAIFPLPFEWSTGPTLAFSRTVVERRAATNVVGTNAMQDTASTLLKGSVNLDGRDQIANLLAFFDAQLGRQQRFWAPSGKRDFKVISTANNSALVTVENCGFTLGEWGDSLHTPRIFILVRDVTNSAWYARRITGSAVIDDNTEQLTLSSAIPHADSASHVSFLYLARFNFDDIEVDFEDTDHATAAVEFMELPNETSDFVTANASAGTMDAEGVLLA